MNPASQSNHFPPGRGPTQWPHPPLDIPVITIDEEDTPRRSARCGKPSKKVEMELEESKQRVTESAVLAHSLSSLQPGPSTQPSVQDLSPGIQESVCVTLTPGLVRGPRPEIPRQPPPGTRHVRPGVGRSRVGAAVTGLHRRGGDRRPLPAVFGRRSNSRYLTPQAGHLTSPQYLHLSSPVIGIPSSPPPQSDQCLPPSPPEEEGQSFSISTLATTFHQLGEREGRRRLVQFKLTERQVRALNTLGFRQEEE
eukprot:GFUD01001621.1.p1 GENE.GFUD01001621.1~~GFUD01001621.1.p1  ORF type:complete len:252 (-),score=95.55 GFUD01001621.1:21-776(-)